MSFFGDLSEKKTVRELRDGSQEAFSDLFKIYSKKLYNFSYKYTQSGPEAEEVVQEVFLKIWKNRTKLDPELSFNAYIITIAKNHIFNGMKKKANEQFYKQYLTNQGTNDNSTENKIIFTNYEEVAQECIDKLPPKRKQIFMLRRESGLTIKEIAEKLNISSSTVENQMNKAMKTIKIDLSKHKIS